MSFNLLTVILNQNNLNSILDLFKQGYFILFNNEIFIKLNESFRCSGKLVDGLYLITPKMYEIHDTKLNKKLQNLPLKRKISFNNSTYICHLRLGDINLKMIDRLVKDDLLSSLTIQLLPICSSCLEEKMTKIPFSTNGNRAREGFEYFITFINDYSIYGYVYILHRKYEAFEKFKEFWAEVETQLNKNINF